MTQSGGAGSARLALRETLNHLRDTHREIAGLSREAGSQHAKALVDARRRLAAHMSQLHALVEPLLVDLPPAVIRRYRELFSDMRSAAALHQAEWPAVRLTSNSQEYAKSAAAVRERHAMFDSWARTALTEGDDVHVSSDS